MANMEDGLNLVPKGDIALIEWDLTDEKVNKLSTPVMEKFQKILNELKTSQYKIAVMISRKPRIFIAGADIKEIQNLKTPEEAQKACRMGQHIMNQIEDLPIPVIAAIHGACLGGGCEMVLACDYRMATDDPSTRIGLPETKLGVIPGFGGCWRLPRLIGLQSALDIILGGKAVNGKKALKLGLIDHLVSPYVLEDQAFKWAQQLIASGVKKHTKKFRPKTWLAKYLNSFLGSPIVFHQAKKMVMKKTGGHYPAIFKAIEAIRSTHGLSDRDKAMKIESQTFSQVAAGPVSQNLIGLFYLTEAIKKQTGLEKDQDIKPLPVKQVGVLGAGTMGGGIAQLMADKGLKVRVKDLHNKALALGLQEASRLWQVQLKRRRITKSEFSQKLNLLSVGLAYEGFEQLDVVIEAVVEDMAVKKAVISDLAKHCSDECLIATNTSSLSVTKMAEAHSKPENVVGMHFFNPVYKMPLVELVRGEKSSDQAVTTIFQLAKKIGKTPIVVKDRPGFLVNRLLLPYLNEAVYLLEEGYPIGFIDEVFVNFGMPMGPLRLLDEIGIDVATKVAHIFHQSFGDRAKPASLMSQMPYHGKKQKKGFYLYNDKFKEIGENLDIYKQGQIKNLQEHLSEEIGENVLERGLYAMINEASYILLEEQVAASAKDVDLAMILGTGFPPFRGGLLHFADQKGLSHIAGRLQEFHSLHGPRFECYPSLKKLATSNKPYFHSKIGSQNETKDL